LVKRTLCAAAIKYPEISELSSLVGFCVVFGEIRNPKSEIRNPKSEIQTPKMDVALNLGGSSKLVRVDPVHAALLMRELDLYIANK
jgi:hypothetical protein